MTIIIVNNCRQSSTQCGCTICYCLLYYCELVWIVFYMLNLNVAHGFECDYHKYWTTNWWYSWLRMRFNKMLYFENDYNLFMHMNQWMFYRVDLDALRCTSINSIRYCAFESVSEYDFIDQYTDVACKLKELYRLSLCFSTHFKTIDATLWNGGTRCYTVSS